MRGIVLLFATLLLVSLPVATAQPYPSPPVVRIDTEADPVLVMPETATAVIPIDVLIECYPWSYTTDPMHVSVGVPHPPANVSVQFSPTTVSYADDPDDCLNPATHSVRVIPFDAAVQVSRDAPAFHDHRIDFDVTLQRGNQTYGPYEGFFFVRPDYLPAITAVPVHSSIVLGPGERGRMPVEVTNRGNGDTRIDMEIQPTSPHELAVALDPPPFVLESQAVHGPGAKTIKQVPIMVRTPTGVGSGNHFTFDVVATGTYAGTGTDASDTATVELAVWIGAPDDPIEAYDAVVPGPDVFSLLAAMLTGLVWHAARRRQ